MQAGGRDRRQEKPSRRDFLKIGAVAAAGVVTGSHTIARAVGQLGPQPAAAGRGNAMPGRIILYRDAEMDGHQATIDAARVEEAVHNAIRLLTGEEETAAAFEALFPGLHSGATIAIKPNCLSWNDTRWEMVRGIVSGLSMMLSGAYDVSQVTIYDIHIDLFDHGYTSANLTFGGNTPNIVNGNNCGGYYVYGSHRLSNFVIDSDFLINVPVLKAHNVGYPEHEITTALKNHYGSLCPASLCNNIPGMLTVNSDAYVKDKTALVLTSAIRGAYQGGPWEPPQEWNTFPEPTPNMLLATTDPITESYWARDLINAERTTHGWSTFACPWIEDGSTDPYNLGVSDPAEMAVVHYDAAGAVDDGALQIGGTFLAANVPNPVGDRTRVRFRLEQAGVASVAIHDVSGRVVRHLTERGFPAGYSEVPWNARGDGGQRLDSGVYFVSLRVGQVHQSKKLLVQ